MDTKIDIISPREVEFTDHWNDKLFLTNYGKDIGLDMGDESVLLSPELARRLRDELSAMIEENSNVT